MAKKGLGKGLDSLFDAGGNIEEKPNKKNAISTSNQNADSSGITYLKLSEVEPNKNQPRRSFDEEQLKALAESIKENGLIQPIIVIRDGSRYKIVAGERRWRASRLAGIKEIPVLIREYSDEQIQEVALIENLQREDLNPIEEALGYSTLIDEFNLTQENISKKIGKSRSAIANSLRLLTLDEKIKAMLIDGSLSSGHARAVLSVEDKTARLALAEKIIEDKLNVRQAEALAKNISKKKRNKPSPDPTAQAAAEELSERLSSTFGTRVTVKHGAKKGKIEIEYFGNDDLDRILSLLNYK